VNNNDFQAYGFLVFAFGVWQFEQQTARKRKLLTLAGIILIGGCVAFSASRSATVGMLIFALLYLWKKRPGPRMVALFAGLLLLFGALIYWRFHTHNDPYSVSRILIWCSALQALRVDPFLGT